jgi:hypothetical protein
MKIRTKIIQNLEWYIQSNLEHRYSLPVKTEKELFMADCDCNIPRNSHVSFNGLYRLYFQSKTKFMQRCCVTVPQYRIRPHFSAIKVDNPVPTAFASGGLI